jgi:hypothetical protein
MTVTDAERQRIIADHEAEKREALRLRMSELGKSKSAKKRKAAIKNLFEHARPQRAQEKRAKKSVRKMRDMRIP